ncbi:acetylcholine receptor subunit alpha-like [Aplysia californica]|uniref:Acetylcholine receptor subunit alpha-like n=1 Tax=Aplysia californica TaxID=6500 RepID=A0ABM1VQR8_APLCA|nr:acetylcholine receptor subunit alpha-like [Aplysia californica]
MRVTIPLLLCLVTVQATPITSATTDDFLRLHQKLTSNYSTHMRPVLNQSESLPVRVSTRLLSVTGVDEPRQLVTIVCAVRYSWFDPFLTWDPAEYGGIDVMYLEQDNIWTPDMYQLHSPDGRGVLTELPTHHITLPSGKVTYRSTGTFTTFCNLDMTYFPYDQQTCLFKFGVLDAVLKNVELVSDGVEVSQEFVGHIEWDVEDMQLVQAVYGREDEQFSVTEVVVTLRRRPRYFEVSMIVPVSVVSFLSLPSFLVSAESGERLSYSLTVLLSLAVYVSSTSSLMPHSSIKLPLLLLYLLMLFLLSSLCVLINVLLIYLRRTGKVLTAAHCLDGQSVYNLRVGLGWHQLTTPHGSEQIHNIASISVHKDYNPNAGGYPNDIAILTLENAAQLNNYVGLAKLAKSDSSFAYQSCIISGWGQLSGSGGSADFLKQASITKITNADCLDLWDGVPGARIYDTHICVYEQPKSSCSGDSGGPMICDGYLAGVTSWGVSSCDGTFPSVYVRVSEFLFWIENQL